MPFFCISLWTWAFVGGEVSGYRLYSYLHSFIRASRMKGFKHISLTQSLLSRKGNWKFSSHLLSLCSCEQQFYFFKIYLDFLICTTENQCSFLVPKVHPAIKDVLKTSRWLEIICILLVRTVHKILLLNRKVRIFVDYWWDVFFVSPSVLEIFSFSLI